MVDGSRSTETERYQVTVLGNGEKSAETQSIND